MGAHVQRIACVMDELTQKLTLLSMVNHQVVEALHDNDSGHAFELVGPDLLKRMVEQIRLEDLYHGSAATGDEAAATSLYVDDMQEIVEQLERNTGELGAKMREVPDLVQELRLLQEVKPVNFMRFIHAVADMHDVLLKRFLTPLEDEKANEDLLHLYLQQERASAERRADLETQLARLRTERQKHSIRSSDAIAKLKSDLHDIQSTTEQRLWQINEDICRQDAQQTRAFHRKAGDSATLKAQLEKREAIQTAAAREEMDATNRSHRIARRELEHTIRTLDRDVAQKERDIEELSHRNECDEKSLACLMKALSAVYEEKERKENAAQIARLLSDRAKAEHTSKVDAACLLQSYWRGINQREEYLEFKKAATRKVKKKSASKK
ncbi:IQ domain-containing protein [Cyclospora cayetanensis]|nr:IQ domain-containing protein [Cyclospora cayetanensis]